MKTKLFHITAFIIIICYTLTYFSTIITDNGEFIYSREKIKANVKIDSFFNKPKITKNERKSTSPPLKFLPVNLFINSSDKINNLIAIQLLHELKTIFLLKHQNNSLLRDPPICSKYISLS